jgi:hypothetical protein
LGIEAGVTALVELSIAGYRKYLNYHFAYQLTSCAQKAIFEIFHIEIAPGLLIEKREDNMLQVYLDPCTVNSRKVLAGLDLLGTQYEFHHVNYFTGEHKSPSYLQINPNGTYVEHSLSLAHRTRVEVLKTYLLSNARDY